MNYWIKYTVIFPLVFIGIISGVAQDSQIINVRGVHKSIQEPIRKSMEFSFVENGVTCGPNAQFESIDEQYYYFIYELLKDEELAKRIQEVEYIANNSSKQPKKTYSFTFESEEEMKKVYNLAEEAFAENFNYFNHYNDKEWSDEYDSAIAALANAQEKANVLAKTQGFTSVEIVSIDDNTGASVGVKLQSSYRRNKRNSRYNTYGGLPTAYYLDVQFKLSK